MSRVLMVPTTALLAVSAVITGCSSETNDKSNNTENANDRPVVITTNYPLQYFVQRLAGPLVEVKCPTGTSGDPAYWNPKPEDVAAMQQADLIVLNGASYEQWIGRVSLPQAKLVDTSEACHNRLLPLAESVTHSHGLEGEHEHAGTAFTTWLDMTLALEQAQAVKTALATRWPEHSSDFDQQFADLKEDLQRLDEELQSAVASAPNRAIVFSHPVYQYLSKRYGIKARSVHWEPGEAPSETMWTELREMLAAQPAQWMIWEAKPQDDVEAQLQQLGLESAVFDPCSTMPPTGDFLSVMRQNVESLRRVFAAP